MAIAHAARLGFFYKNALYKFTVIIIIIINAMIIVTLSQFAAGTST